MTDWNRAEQAINVLCRKRTLDALAALEHCVRGHNELARVTDMDNKSLSRALQHMIRAGLVQRSVLSSRPSLRVHYSLTSHARDLIVLLDGLARWHGDWRREDWTYVDIPARSVAAGSVYSR